MGFLFVAAKSNLQTHNAGLMAYFCCMMFLHRLLCCCIDCDRWSEQHLVKLNSAGLLGDWVGSVFFSFKVGVFVILLLCGGVTPLSETHCEVLS